MHVLRTARLLLRDWRDSDHEPFAEMGQDPEVMACFPWLLTRERSDATIARIGDHITREGFGFWAVEVVGVAPFIGFCGLARPAFTTHFTPCVEIGWRLARAHWGQGYASEGARAALGFGWDTLRLDEIVAFLLPANVRSATVCERIGMERDLGGDFDHPQIAEGAISVAGHSQRLHRLYRLRRQNATVAKVEPPKS